MSSPSFIRSNLATILNLAITQLTTYALIGGPTGTAIDPSRIFVSVLDADSCPLFDGDQDVILRVMGERREGGMLEGAGRVDDRRTREIQVVMRSRVYLDQVEQDLIRLTDASLGHLWLEDAVADALEIFMATDGDGNVLTTPWYLEGPTAPQAMRNDRNWVWSAFTCSFDYERALDQSRQ